MKKSSFHSCLRHVLIMHFFVLVFFCVGCSSGSELISLNTASSDVQLEALEGKEYIANAEATRVAFRVPCDHKTNFLVYSDQFWIDCAQIDWGECKLNSFVVLNVQLKENTSGENREGTIFLAREDYTYSIRIVQNAN